MRIGERRRPGWRRVRSVRSYLAVAVAMLLIISCATSADVADLPDPTTSPVTTSPQADSTSAAALLTPVPQPTQSEPRQSEPTRAPATAVPTPQPPSESAVAATPVATLTPVATSTPLPATPTTAVTPAATATPTAPPPGDRWSARKLLVDLDDAAVAREIAALDAQRSPGQVLVIAKDTSCGLLDTHAIPMPAGVVVEIFSDERIQCLRAVESTALFLIDAAGTNSHGSWNYRSAPLVNIIRTGVEERPTPVPPGPGASPIPAVERVVAGPAPAGIAATTVLTDPGPGDVDGVLAVIEAANSSGARIVVAGFQGCVLIEARAIPMPTQVVVRATFDADIDCFRAYNYQAFFVIESTGVNTHGAWNYAQPPKVMVEYIDQA